MNPLILLSLTVPCQANLFDFIQNQFHHGSQANRESNFEIDTLNQNCNKYLCQDTLQCVDEPKLCPCPFPSSQLRCFLPNGNYICISKPADSDEYNDPQNNWRVDAKDDNIRDCGWVSRAYKGLI